MVCYRYSERDLFDFAFKNVQDTELLEVLIRDFGLNVNLRSGEFYDTLLYASLKCDLKIAKFLVSKGACVNASLGGYPDDKKEQSYGYGSILDFTKGFHSLSDDPNWLENCGAVSFEKLPEETKKEKIKLLDITRVANDNNKIVRARDQIVLVCETSSKNVKNKIKNFISSCEVLDLNDLLSNDKLSI